MKYYILFIFIVIASLSCNKKTNSSTAPIIKFNKQSTTYFPSGLNAKVSVYFDVVDKEGDVGFNEGNVYFVDSRYPTDTQVYTTPNVPFKNGNTFKGLFETQIEGGFLIARLDSPIHYLTDTLIWTISLKDKAGNRSNFINSKELILYK